MKRRDATTAWAKTLDLSMQCYEKSGPERRAALSRRGRASFGELAL
jgi:hypothetical protein